MKFTLPKLTRTAILLLALADDIGEALIGPNALCTVGNMHRLSRKMNMGQTQFQATLRSLKEQNYIKQIEKGKYLITPKGQNKIKSFEMFRSPARRKVEDWNGSWKVVIFDIPESKRGERNLFRSVLKRKGFIRLQNSVFVAPFADFDELDAIRRKLSIEKFVNFLDAKSSGRDNDSLLREEFGLKD